MNKEMTKEKNKDISKIETIFDHNITDKEREYITHSLSKEEYLKEVDYDQDECYFDLSRLYRYKGNINLSDYENLRRNEDKYFNMISKKNQVEYMRDIEKIHALYLFDG